MMRFWGSILGAVVALVMASGCSHPTHSPGLSPTTVMGTVRGNQFVRVITHFHTPHSFDACDGKGLAADGTPAQWCVNDIRYALCENHINLTFFTDHVEHVADTDYAALQLSEPGDTPVVKSGNVIANTIACPDGFAATTMPGLEGQLLALGMENHISGTVDDRKATYGGDQTAQRDQIESETNAIVGIPHTESRDPTYLKNFMSPYSSNVMEIYNLHANLDPKLRKKWLNMKPFEHIAKFLNYIIDPFNELNADYLFMEFLQMSDLYFDRWDSLLSQGISVTGVGGLDSHENIFSQKASDGERLDSHRRMTRFMNNLVLTPSTDIDDIKDSIRAGRVFFVLEGFGTPIGLDFYGYDGTNTIEMGGSFPVASGTSITLKVPTIQAGFPGTDQSEKPDVSAILYFINSSGQRTVVARSSGQGSEIVYPNPPAGHYRAEVWMVPHQMRSFLFNKKYADQPYRWVTTNAIWVQ